MDGGSGGEQGGHKERVGRCGEGVERGADALLVDRCHSAPASIATAIAASLRSEFCARLRGVCEGLTVRSLLSLAHSIMLAMCMCYDHAIRLNAGVGSYFASRVPQLVPIDCEWRIRCARSWIGLALHGAAPPAVHAARCHCDPRCTGRGRRLSRRAAAGGGG